MSIEGIVFMLAQELSLLIEYKEQPEKYYLVYL